MSLSQCQSLDIEGLPHWWHHQDSPMMSLGGISSLISPESNKLWYWYQYLLIYLIILPLFKTFCLIHVSPVFSYWMDSVVSLLCVSSQYKYYFFPLVTLLVVPCGSPTCTNNNNNIWRSNTSHADSLSILDMALSSIMWQPVPTGSLLPLALSVVPHTGLTTLAISPGIAFTSLTTGSQWTTFISTSMLSFIGCPMSANLPSSRGDAVPHCTIHHGTWLCHDAT